MRTGGADSDTRSGDGPAVGQLSCSMASTLVRHLRVTLGDEVVQDVIRVAGVDYTTTYLEDVGNWIWYHEAVALFEAAVTVTGDQGIACRIGEETVRQHAGTPVATLLRSLGSPQAVYEQLTVGVTKFSTVTELIPSEVGPGRALVRANARPGFKRHRHLCDWTAGMLSQPPVLFGLPPAQVEETSCQVRGDDHCLYEITWDAEGAARAADPQQLVTALETQLAAMSDRLQSMYATARDLIALDDLDAALARITERAATAVRAPKYLLAVRTGADAQLHVHHRGFNDEDPAEVARALLDDTDGGQGIGRLVANVASGSRHYGRLMAASPAGAFFPHERELLDVYARFAATVLDTATAFDEARRRDEQSRALLELSGAVAMAGTRDEVAQRLADAIPAVVDCDRVAAFLWDEQEDALVCRAVTGSTGDDEVIRTLRVRPSDTEHLASLIDNPTAGPIFCERDTPDQFIAATMRRTGAQALIMVPIVSHERFYGVLNVSVTERPERLQPTSELRGLLAGVVAQGATALDNARLIETMAHQARFDSLTGLLGHRAFHESLKIQLEQRGGQFALAAIDIDDFKLVNDLHGHPVGDQALTRVADALRSSVREQDAVFRVGGEEFAVLMPGLAAADAMPVAERVRAAVARTAFALPLRVSVGVASWPADAADRDTLLESTDAALYAAKRAGKDRVVGPGSVDVPASARNSEASRTSLLQLLRAKDPATVGHSAHVAALAVEVGERLGISSDRLGDLRVAGQLHDIGKVAVPKAILTKPGPLDAEEMSIVRTHPVVGAELVRAAGLPAASRFVLEHHERVDGTGYPAGLAGDSISLEGRILHAVDAYAAMTTDRPYRCAMSADKAIAELLRASGTQFDARVARALVEALAARDAQSPSWTVDTVTDSAPARQPDTGQS
jgi:diguanylate cyclase (GGDEF)-like protein/putative nucleotidyltransferase with HDIG domain